MYPFRELAGQTRRPAVEAQVAETTARVRRWLISTASSRVTRSRSPSVAMAEALIPDTAVAPNRRTAVLRRVIVRRASSVWASR
ncbi:MAG: hypothetical protein OXS29_02880 [bacterium]|nr:hypothetical protein [bacterium]MDE0290858.1 hypothetical protein [bacterium]MDE0439226.1 hypothetical protein [bacterium]